uniref:CSON014403 protein n=1 Tax=Culicoides sonorensis TaxID=179676 RepID=A0A336MAN1_CULSO
MLIFHGTCDICKRENELLGNPNEKVGKSLSLVYAIKLSNPLMWRICTKCNYEIGNFILKYATTIQTHPFQKEPNQNKCFCCGNNTVILDEIVPKLIKELHTLPVPLADNENLNACFECIFLMKVVLEYKNLLQLSQMGMNCVGPFLKLTETINTAKAKVKSSEKKKITRKYVRKVPNDAPKPPLKKCLIVLEKIDFNNIDQLMVNNSRPNKKKKIESKPIKLPVGADWTHSGLNHAEFSKASATSTPVRAKKTTSKSNGLNESTKNKPSPLLNGILPTITLNGIDHEPKPGPSVKAKKRSRSNSVALPEVSTNSVLDRGYITDSEKDSRKRSKILKKDFIYFTDTELKQPSEKKPRKQTVSRKKRKQQKPKQDMNKSVKNCVVTIERVSLPTPVHAPADTKEPEHYEEIHLSSSDESMNENRDEIIHINNSEPSNELPPLNAISAQNENSAPNIPVQQTLSDIDDDPSDPNGGAIQEYNCMNSSSITTFRRISNGTLSTPIKSILSPDRGFNASSSTKSVSFSQVNEMIYYSPEEDANEISLEDLVEDPPITNDTQMESQENSHDDEYSEILETVKQEFF